MTLTFLLIGIIAAFLLLLTFIVGDFLDFLNFDFLDGVLGTSSILSFFSLFGFSGTIVLYNTEWGFWGAVIVGFIVGAVAAMGVGTLMRYLQNSDSGMVSDENLVGTKAFVVLPIPAGGYGKIQVTNAGHTMEVSALSSNNDPVARGTQVVIDAITGPGVVKISILQD